MPAAAGKVRRVTTPLGPLGQSIPPRRAAAAAAADANGARASVGYATSLGGRREALERVPWLRPLRVSTTDNSTRPTLDRR